MSRDVRTGPYEISPEPTLEEIMAVRERRLKLSIRTNTVGTVVAFNPALCTATVTVDILQIVKVLVEVTPGVDPNAINLVAPSIPFTLVDIPVYFPRGGTGEMTMPLVPGDTGELEIQDRGLQQWLLRLSQVPVDPVTAMTHALQDAVFHPGLLDRVHQAALPPVDMTATVLHHDAMIRLGRSAVLGIARLLDGLQASEALTTWALAVEAALVVALAPIAPAASWTALGLAAPDQLGNISSASTRSTSL